MSVNQRRTFFTTIIQQTVVVANGASCRHQIDDLTGRKAVHLAVALAELLEG